MKIYTKTGDNGKTSLFGGDKVSKINYRIEAFGTLDELSSYLGLIRSFDLETNISDELLEIQNDLFAMGAEIATPTDKLYLENGSCRLKRLILEKDAKKMERWIDIHTKKLEPLSHFVLPGGDILNAHCHIARTICRRAERRVVGLYEQKEIRKEILVYLNRLSDYLFTIARLISKINSKKEIQWIG